jgi:hypothetical protein
MYPSCTDPIEQQMNLDARTSTIGKRIGKCFADGTGPINEGLESDGLHGTTDCLQHGGEDLVGVQQPRDVEGVLSLSRAM